MLQHLLWHSEEDQSTILIQQNCFVKHLEDLRRGGDRN
jgi:hypothetical protein